MEAGYLANAVQFLMGGYARIALSTACATASRASATDLPELTYIAVFAANLDLELHSFKLYLVLSCL